MLLRKFLLGFGPPNPIEALKMLKDDSKVEWPAFGPDGARLAAAGDNLSVWDLWSLRKIYTLPLIDSAIGSRLVAWSESNLLAVLDRAGRRLQILDGAQDFAVLQVLEFEQGGPIGDFAFSADGSQLLIAQRNDSGGEDEPSAVVYNTQDWSKMILRTALRNEAVAWFGDEIVVVGHSFPSGFLSYARFNPTETTLPKPARLVPSAANHISVLVCPAKNLIIVASKGVDTGNVTRLRLINPVSKTVFKVIDMPGTLGTGMTFAGNRLVLCLTSPQQRQIIKLLDLNTFLFQTKTFSCRFNSGMAMSLDGKQLAFTHQKNIFTYRVQDCQ